MNPSLRTLSRFLPHLSLGIGLCSLAISYSTFNSDSVKRYHQQDMANTIGPLLRTVAEKACYGDSTPINQAAVVTLKQEPRESCIGGTGNAMYARCFDFVSKLDERFDPGLGVNVYAIPMKDIPLFPGESYSCIDVDEISLPSLYEGIRIAEIGEPVVRF